MEISTGIKRDKVDMLLKSIVLACALITIFLGIFVLAGWALGFNGICSFGKNFLPMAEETALLFLISGISLAFTSKKRSGWIDPVFPRGFALVIGIFAILAIVDSKTDYVWNLSDFIGPTDIIKEGFVSGRMSNLTALCFLFLSIALFLLTTKARNYSPIFSMAVLFTGYAISVGYYYGVPPLYGGKIIPMAWPTAIAFIVSSLGFLIAVGRQNKPVRYFIGDSTRARMLRSLMPLIFLIMIAQNYFDAYYNDHFSQASALINSVIDIISLFAVGASISFFSRSIGNSIDSNIAKRELVEIELQRSEYDLKKAQQITHIGSFKIDLATNMVFWSEELYKMYGFDPVLPPPLLDESQKLFTPESWLLLSTSISNTAQTGVPYEIELQTLRFDGSNGWMWARGEAITDSTGKITEIWGAAQDITERKFIQEELRLAKERAEESDQLKSAFLANMSHEIRTPMNGILGFADLLKEPNLSGEDQLKYIEIIEKSGIRMLNIINDIIDISKIESGLMNVDLKESNINDQIEFIYAFFKQEVERKGIKLFYRRFFSDHEAIIVTDREKLFAILTNLVKNAIKYSEAGTIEIGYVKKDQFLEFFVKDTGIGIPKERQGAIFERFIQADIKDSKSLQGAGLGLAISKSYVEMLGGEIWVESEVGTGSTFFFTIPTCIDVAENFDNDKIFLINDKKDMQKSLKVLVVEDDEISVIYISKIINELSNSILYATTGIEAVEICRVNRDLDLILMDIGLPDLNGHEATRQIRHFNSQVVIIAQTAFGLTGDREKAINAGCNDYIAKPIYKSELHGLIHKHCCKVVSM